MSRSIFARHRLFSPPACSEEFITGLHRLARYHVLKGGTPSVTSRDSDGFPVGKWLAEKQRNPHTLSYVERAYLLSVPGVVLSDRARVPITPGRIAGDPDQAFLWRHIRQWAVPEKEPAYV